MLTRNAVGNLIKKYSAVLKKCAWLNACVLTGAVVCGGLAPSSVMAAGTVQEELQTLLGTTDDSYTLTSDIQLKPYLGASVGQITINGSCDANNVPLFSITSTRDDGSAIPNKTKLYLNDIKMNNVNVNNSENSYCEMHNVYMLDNKRSCGIFGAAVSIQSNANVEIYDSTFEGNEAGAGGAIGTSSFHPSIGGSIAGDRKVSIKGATFNGNKAFYEMSIPYQGCGGAILFTTEEFSVEDTLFTKNAGDSSGGAIYIINETEDKNGPAEFTNVSFGGKDENGNSLGNIAEVDGGAIYMEGASETTVKQINYDLNGATLHYTATTSDINISGNKAAEDGGFLYLDGNNGYSDQGLVGARAIFDVQGADTTLTIGAADLLNDTDDSIYTETGATFTKKGAGKLLVRSTYTNEGAFIVDDGAMILEGDIAKEGEQYWFESTDVQTALGGTSKVLMLGTSLNVGDGIYVGESAPQDIQTNPNNGAHFGGSSALVVHADGTGAQNAYDSNTPQAAIIGKGAGSVLTIASGAKLIVHGGDPSGADFRIAENFETADVETTGEEVEDSQWTVKHSNPLYAVDKAYWKQEEKSATPAVTGRSLASPTASGTDVADNYYVRFTVSPQAQEILGDLAQLASIAGVASNTASIATSAMDASGARFAFGAFEPELERSFNLWATPLFSSVYADGFDSSRDGKGGRSGYDTTYGGMNIGADYTTDAGYRFGLGLHAGYGETESHGDYEHTDNDFSFWGVTLYGGRTWDDFSVYADVNMSMTKSDLVQNNPLFADAPLEAETDAYALTAELRADYRISTEYMEILPHVGARFMNVNIDDYDVKQLGDTICSVESQDQNIWSFPVGVELSKTFDLGAPSQDGQEGQAVQNDWTLTPRLDLGVIFAAGDIDADSTAFMPDRSVSQSMTMQTFDRFAYTANIGVDMEYGASTFALEYGTRLSEHQTVQDVTATWRYEF